jgi:hypothetical protein
VIISANQWLKSFLWELCAFEKKIYVSRFNNRNGVPSWRAAGIINPFKGERQRSQNY